MTDQRSGTLTSRCYLDDDDLMFNMSLEDRIVVPANAQVMTDVARRSRPSTRTATASESTRHSRPTIAATIASTTTSSTLPQRPFSTAQWTHIMQNDHISLSYFPHDNGTSYTIKIPIDGQTDDEQPSISLVSHINSNITEVDWLRMMEMIGGGVDTAEGEMTIVDEVATELKNGLASQSEIAAVTKDVLDRLKDFYRDVIRTG
ncbi:hypothetical protein I308_106624 [Cryptococcus tetragattii IND107]|uniref:Uncharacterized protein n=1 Tax=Cryptococcus tetragattii IND107 TaxID=1296105 RepID=A0ABR3BI47_9TREE|nr:hypothetical protein I308_06738 [Cryptococcus tetragattii IND107]